MLIHVDLCGRRQMSSCNLAAGKEPMLPPTQQVVSSGDQAIKAGQNYAEL